MAEALETTDSCIREEEKAPTAHVKAEGEMRTPHRADMLHSARSACFSQGCGASILTLFYMYTGSEQKNKRDSGNQVSYSQREKLQVSEKGTLRYMV